MACSQRYPTEIGNISTQNTRPVGYFTKLFIHQYATSEGSGATVHLEPSPFANIYSAILSRIFTEISPFETPITGASRMGMLRCLCTIKSSHKLIVSYPFI